MSARLLAPLAVLLVMEACGGSASGPAPQAPGKEAAHAAGTGAGEEAAAESATKPAPGTVTLTPAQVQSIGLVTMKLPSVRHRREITGYGTVLGHETFAQPLAELRVAEAAAHQSGAGLERARGLAGTPGAVSADVLDSAERQSAVDTASVALARQKLATLIGSAPPFGSAQRTLLLTKLASGAVKLVRASFPSGSLGEETPVSLRATLVAAAAGERGFELKPVWPAPADPAIPGRSFFALLERAGIAEGDRLSVHAAGGGVEDGVVIPAAAVVMSEGKYWCYLEHAPGTFERTAIDLDEPTTDGYFEPHGGHGPNAGNLVVTTAAAQLLAQESNPGAEPD